MDSNCESLYYSNRITRKVFVVYLRQIQPECRDLRYVRMTRDTAVVHTTYVNNLHTHLVDRALKRELRVQEQNRCVLRAQRGGEALCSALLSSCAPVATAPPVCAPLFAAG
jgi:hypothetical protein